jgi:hypothetical protein
LYLKDADAIRKNFEALVVGGGRKIGLKMIEDLKY